MYPELTWQEEVLSKINTYLQHPLSLPEITLTPAWYGASGRLRLAITPTNQSRYYAEEPVMAYLQRRDINKLFIKHQPFIVVADKTTIADSLTLLFKKYGLGINPTIFDSSTLTQTIVFETAEKIIPILVRSDASESWYGTFNFLARKATSNSINELYTVLAPLTSNYPEDELQSDLHALNTYGIRLDLSTQDTIRSLSVGDSPKGRNTFRLAAALISMDYTLAWELVTSASVVYNGKVADAADINTSLLPSFGKSVLVLKPHADSGVSSHLYFSYD
jgi:hypothetical protein